MIDSIPEYVVLTSRTEIIKIRVPRISVKSLYELIAEPQIRDDNLSVTYNFFPGPTITNHLSPGIFEQIKKIAIAERWVV